MAESRSRGRSAPCPHRATRRANVRGLSDPASSNPPARPPSAEDILADLMGSFLIVAPAVFGIVFAYWLFKCDRCARAVLSVWKKVVHPNNRSADRDQDVCLPPLAIHQVAMDLACSARRERTMRRSSAAWSARTSPAARLTPTRRSVQDLPRHPERRQRGLLAAEYRMCLAFLVVFGFFMIFFLARTEAGWDFKIGTLTAFSFLVGGITSMVSGYPGTIADFVGDNVHHDAHDPRGHRLEGILRSAFAAAPSWASPSPASDSLRHVPSRASPCATRASTSRPNP